MAGHGPMNSTLTAVLTLVVVKYAMRTSVRVFFETNSAAAERADSQPEPLARLTPGCLPLTALGVP